jgi:hypothetical protein
MKKLIILFAVVVNFVGFTTMAQEVSKAKFAFNEEKHDFKKISQGTPVTVEFVYTNVGTESLQITEVKPTFDCVIVDVLPKGADGRPLPVPPGGTGVIKIAYNASIAVPFSKGITVLSKSTTPTKTLYLVGEVVAN